MCVQTPSYIASENGHEQALRVLAEHKADLNQALNNGAVSHELPCVAVVCSRILSGDTMCFLSDVMLPGLWWLLLFRWVCG